ncbi:ATP-binding protein [Ralstonia mannitolilytica]|uniref:histidine kinase n=1 Tax=Ralstonia mannitolilytica TaxID=105219 RepID=A0AAD2ANA2_9RALS|nr:ATP-binding protein [Ralstonia mannitolilytica]ANA35090.1 membrane protein [Ralstonia mannitolilytica]MBY4717071.1 sensor histidine kinase N-terminal domain-containing protein [Ralstonia mannitolilytica]CAJ0680379.1 Sensor protein QseC [Ralstonia mannitolilytica]CAJ0684411.1 Sensor protein QseC [Ralstonia mannitolilytica]CAJ0710318.1 Sensor protein QseC [Ralstonia mannitolilytica]
MQSIRKTLLWWLAGGLLAGIVVATGLIYAQARQEANALFDYQMQQVAAALPSQWIDPPPPALAGIARDDDVVIRIWDGSGRSLYLSHARPDLPERAELGFSDVSTPEGAWRVYSVAFGPAVVQIAQPYSARHEVAARMALRTVAPLLILLPLLAWIVWLAVGRGLAPLGTVAQQVQARDAAALSPLPTHGLPAEIRPLTNALNDLLVRLGTALAHQRAFVADAAHALRTPLAALKLQLQVADRAQDEDERRAAHADLHRGVERMIRLVGQLLTLARQEPGAADTQRAPVALDAVAADVVGELSATAVQKGIDLGIAVESQPASVIGNADALRVLLVNLVDNALCYCPRGARVDVITGHAPDGGAQLVVEDNGPGIPAEERERVLDRFYRPTQAPTGGSGLGLAIVREIAQAHDATLALEEREGGGLRVVLRFPFQARA